ncbi:MAG: hypothetical protein WCC60_19860 [Ilumatobacteraceae bacterium]
MAQAVTQAYRVGVRVRLDVAKADVRIGHVHLEVAERNVLGDLLEQARAVIWARTANTIEPAFVKSTNVVLGAGIKLLVRAKPSTRCTISLPCGWPVGEHPKVVDPVTFASMVRRTAPRWRRASPVTPGAPKGPG